MQSIRVFLFFRWRRFAQLPTGGRTATGGVRRLLFPPFSQRHRFIHSSFCIAAASKDCLHLQKTTVLLMMVKTCKAEIAEASNERCRATSPYRSFSVASLIGRSGSGTDRRYWRRFFYFLCRSCSTEAVVVAVISDRSCCSWTLHCRGR